MDISTTDHKSASRNHGSVGKVVRGDLYFHVSAALDVTEAARTAMLEASQIVKVEPTTGFNIVKIGRGGTVVSLLAYANFFEDAFPQLERVRTVNLAAGRYRERTYDGGANPPILHKKELLLSLDNPSRPLFEKLTIALEERGIRQNRPGLGFRKQWHEYIANKGVEVRNHRIVDLVNDHH